MTGVRCRGGIDKLNHSAQFFLKEQFSLVCSSILPAVREIDGHQHVAIVATDLDMQLVGVSISDLIGGFRTYTHHIHTPHMMTYV